MSNPSLKESFRVFVNLLYDAGYRAPQIAQESGVSAGKISSARRREARKRTYVATIEEVIALKTYLENVTSKKYSDDGTEQTAQPLLATAEELAALQKALEEEKESKEELQRVMNELKARMQRIEKTLTEKLKSALFL